MTFDCNRWWTDRASSTKQIVPAYKALSEQLRTSILNGQLTAGATLPPNRLLAAETGLSRNTVLAAPEQLQAEVTSRAGRDRAPTLHPEPGPRAGGVSDRLGAGRHVGYMASVFGDHGSQSRPTRRGQRGLSAGGRRLRPGPRPARAGRPGAGQHGFQVGGAGAFGGGRRRPCKWQARKFPMDGHEISPVVAVSLPRGGVEERLAAHNVIVGPKDELTVKSSEEITNGKRGGEKAHLPVWKEIDGNTYRHTLRRRSTSFGGRGWKWRYDATCQFVTTAWPPRQPDEAVPSIESWTIEMKIILCSSGPPRRSKRSVFLLSKMIRSRTIIRRSIYVRSPGRARDVLYRCESPDE
ncbi:MAG: GntR family transcriptional regulator [Mycobacteriales bacterium]